VQHHNHVSFRVFRNTHIFTLLKFCCSVKTIRSHSNNHEE